MSDSLPTLPARPSLEQLRKQAKERLDTMPGAKLADAQFALARDYGFASWPKLARHVEALAAPQVEQHEQIARDMALAYSTGDEAAALRLNDIFHSTITIDQIRRFIEDRLFHVPGGRERMAHFGIADARLVVARLYGFEDWDALLVSTAGPYAVHPVSGISSAPPFYRIDAARGTITPQQPMSARDWDVLIEVIRDRQLTGVEANQMMDDRALAKLADLEHLTVLKLHGSDRLTDDGLRHLARFQALEELEVGGWNSPMTDVGFAAVRALPRLRLLRSWWSRRITDDGVRQSLGPCERLEDVNMMGTSTGDGLIEALAGKPGVQRLFCGTAVTDVGLAHLRRFPRFATWHGGTPACSLLEFDPGPTSLGIKGPFTPAGLAALERLDGLFALNVHWLSPTVGSPDLARLSTLANLGFLAIDGDLCDDEAMRQIGRLQRLRMLLAQGPAAGDEGFKGLSASRTLEYIWGRECPHLTGRGFAALADIPSLKGIALSCKFVEDGALAMLPRFPSLCALMPMDVTDEGFRHVGRCERLEELWCMYCQETGDAATGHIAGLRLASYYAGATKITDRSLETLGQMSTLERINLHACPNVTDGGLRHLAVLPRLRELTIDSLRNVTRAGLGLFPPSVRVRYSTI